MTAPERKLRAQSATEQLKLAAGEEEKHKLNNVWLQQEEGCTHSAFGKLPHGQGGGTKDLQDTQTISAGRPGSTLPAAALQ